MSKKLRLVFLASLMCNALLAGVIMGRGVHHFRPPPPPMADEAAVKLPVEVKEKLDAMWHGLHEKNRPLFQEMRAARRQTIELLMAEPFDETAYTEHTKKIEALRTQTSRNMAESVKELMRSLPQEQRAAVAELLKRPPHKRWRHQRPPPPPPGAESDMPPPPPPPEE